MLKPILLCALLTLCFVFSTVSVNAHNGTVTAAKTTTPVTMDGNDTGGEYPATPQIDIAAPVPGTVKLRTFHDPMTMQETIYFLVTVSDTSPNLTQDVVQIWFDMLHDGGPTADDIGFEIRRDGQMNKLTGTILAPTVVAAWVPVAQQVVLSGAPPAGTWQFEVKMVANDPYLAVAYLPSVMGMLVYVRNQPTGPGSILEDLFPAGATEDTNSWSDLKTRLPIEYMMVLDQSGSMLSFDRWVSAKKAANVLANTLFALKDANYIDQLGMVTFKSNCTTDADTTNLPQALANLPGGFPGDYLAGTPDPLSNNCTPIGKGLAKAFEGGAGTLLVNSQPNKQKERIVLLLSDGFHNSPPADVHLAPAATAYDPCPGTMSWNPCPADIVQRVQVNTIGLGSDTSVDTSRLTDIKNRYNGSIFGATYNLADLTQTEALKQFFISSLDDVFQVNSIPLVGNEFTLNTAERKLLRILSWKTPASASALTLERKATAMDPFSPVACATSNVESVAAGYAICTVNSPQAGIYRATVGGAGPDSQFNLVDLNLPATFAIDRQLHGAGQDLILTARLNEAGVPVTDSAAHPVKVTIDIRRPTEGFGTYVSIHEPGDCEARPPKLPPPGRGSQTTGGFSLPRVPPALVPTPGNEPKPARFAKIDELFARCGKNSLSVTEEPGTAMFDDGTHGDVKANDGIYTLRIQNAETQFEGSYIFRFRAQGKSPSGSDFARSKTMAEYVRVNVDPGSTPVDSRVLQQSGTTIIREYHITPRDRFGGYLGPGHSDQITFNTTAGTFITEINDYNNGIYSRILRFDAATENPVVTVTVQGQPLGPATFNGGGAGGQGFEFFPYIGGSFYQNSLGVKNGFTTGARIGYRFPNQVALEFESGITFSRFEVGPFTGQRAHLIQVLGNVRYDISQWSVGNWTPYVITGAGGVFLRGGVAESAFAFHGGFGSTWQLTNHVGIRADGRVFHFGNLNGASSTTSFQVNGGVVFRF